MSSDGSPDAGGAGFGGAAANRRWWPESSRPLPVEGGLKARSTRGAIGQSWWSGRFIAVLESIIVGGRLQRGHHDGIEVAHHEIALQGHQEGLPLPAARERIGQDVELLHGA